MIETFAALLLAHALADFILQTGWIVANKRRAPAILLHGALVLLTAQAALGQFAAWPLLALAAAHMVIDMIKTFAAPQGLWPFLADQAAHIVVLIGVAMLFPDLWAGGLWAENAILPASMAIVAGMILATRAGGFAVGFLMTPWRQEDLPKGLQNGGALIGILERGLIFILVLVGQPAGIGFLIAAKSVLRFDSTSKDQRAGEYIIIGTLASFGWALITAYLTMALISALPPLEIFPARP